jgi:alpha-tubulin suppressor-like RCC1 family protein
VLGLGAGGGGGGDGAFVAAPTQVMGLGEGGGVDIACGRGHTVCVSGRRVYAWGDEQCGGGGRWVPGEVDGVFWAVAVSCGCNFTAALSVDGEVFTWGKVTRMIPPFEKETGIVG